MILLKSEKTENFYCVDPDHKTKEEFSAYLKQNYDIDSYTWTEIKQN